MRKTLKIILIVFAVLVIAFFSFLGFVFLDVMAYTATGSQTLTPSNSSVGRALVVYDPGLLGNAKGIAEKVAVDLQTNGYIVTLAGIKSSAALNTSGYSVIVAGGPVYGGSLTSSVVSFLKSLNPAAEVKVGVFGSGSFPMSNEVTTLSKSVPSSLNAVVVKINTNEDAKTRSSEFVNLLLQGNQSIS